MEAEDVIRVVVADDAVEVRRRLVAMLAALQGVRIVGEAADVTEALTQVRRLRPAAVVLDIAMPGGNGIGALRTIKAETPRTCVIMLTNHADDLYRRTCLRAGADFFFDKSIEFEQVGRALRSLRPTA